MGMEVCATLGMINAEQAKQLKEAGLTAYNHNLDTSREFYPSVITTRRVPSPVYGALSLVEAEGKVVAGQCSSDVMCLTMPLQAMPPASPMKICAVLLQTVRNSSALGQLMPWPSFQLPSVVSDWLKRSGLIVAVRCCCDFPTGHTKIDWRRSATFARRASPFAAEVSSVLGR